MMLLRVACVLVIEFLIVEFLIEMLLVRVNKIKLKASFGRE